MNYNTILASLLDGISLALKSGNSNVDAEQFNFLTDAINRRSVLYDPYREGYGSDAYDVT